MSLESASAVAVTALGAAGLQGLIRLPDSDLYGERIVDYWPLSAHKRPYCLVHPKSTEDVVASFKVIFGGLIAWGASHIEPDICIDLGAYLDSFDVRKEEGIVSIQPGARWREVYKAIESHGIAVAGGRTGGVGVGEPLTGGGISVPDGRIINANAGENSQLWRALKGASAGNFGIEGLWAGMLISEASPEWTADHVSAIRKFTDNPKKCSDSWYIVLWIYEPIKFKDIILTSFAHHEHDVNARAEAVAKIKAISKTGHFGSLCLFQFVPSYCSRLGEERGGNVMGLDQHLKGRDAISMLLSINITTYINYADKTQDPMGSLLNPEGIKKTALKYDPQAIFQTRTPGGFKISDMNKHGTL
ncbi:FAD linked oxidase [Xylariaceae sp. FL0016]|nr:FAD linked oxidase [Xylariaceae sp. FL0016]